MPMSSLCWNLKFVYNPLFSAQVLRKLCQELIWQMAKSIKTNNNPFLFLKKYMHTEGSGVGVGISEEARMLR